jgi:hypothetical protein
MLQSTPNVKKHKAIIIPYKSPPTKGIWSSKLLSIPLIFVQIIKIFPNISQNIYQPTFQHIPSTNSNKHVTIILTSTKMSKSQQLSSDLLNNLF